MTFQRQSNIADIWVLGSIYLEEKDWELSPEMQIEAGTLVHGVEGQRVGWRGTFLLSRFGDQWSMYMRHSKIHTSGPHLAQPPP